MRYEPLFADRVIGCKTSAIREILKIAGQPGMVSLAGGMPAAESFPLATLRQLIADLFDTDPAAAFQYGPTEGFPPLRHALAELLAEKGLRNATADRVLIVSGSQGLLDAIGKVMISRGDRVAVESPTYLGALQAFAPYRPQLVPIETDSAGILPEALDRAARRSPLKLLYLVPNFQNPSGRTLSADRREAVARLARRHRFVIVEDDPYRMLRYEGRELPPVQQFAPNHVVYAGSLSKVFAPGLRIGFCLAPQIIGGYLTRVKQGCDLHTNTLGQVLAAGFLRGGYLPQQQARLIALYRPRRDAMLDALSHQAPPETTWSTPEGGMFVWLEGSAGVDMDAVNQRCIKRGVAFVPGRYFFHRPEDHPSVGATLRLNFTCVDTRQIRRAVGILCEEIARGTADRMPAAVIRRAGRPPGLPSVFLGASPVRPATDHRGSVPTD